MKSTHADRRAYVLNNGQISGSEIINKYPVLRRLAIVSIMYIYTVDTVYDQSKITFYI